MLRHIAYVLFPALAIPITTGLAGCKETIVEQQPPPNPSEPVALIDLVGGTYTGFVGGLYPASNDPPPDHAGFGAAMARATEPRRADGQPDPAGKVVLLSISMSNATQEWCHQDSHGGAGAPPCNPWTLMGQAASDPAVNHTTLVIANGAQGGQSLETWDDPDDANYNRVRDEVLPAFGVTEAQVQAVWMKVAMQGEPTRPALPDPGADAYVEEATIGDVMRALAVRYPNLRQVFFTSRIYAGYGAPTENSPEPYAYETGFATKWAIEAQIVQRSTGSIDPQAGDLSGVPFMAWGPYLWAPGAVPRLDGLFWPREYFDRDGIHPSELGEDRVADYLLAFFKGSPFTSCWFLAGQTC
jgi:hypothetical protein